MATCSELCPHAALQRCRFGCRECLPGRGRNLLYHYFSPSVWLRRDLPPPLLNRLAVGKTLGSERAASVKAETRPLCAGAKPAINTVVTRRPPHFAASSAKGAPGGPEPICVCWPPAAVCGRRGGRHIVAAGAAAPGRCRRNVGHDSSNNSWIVCTRTRARCRWPLMSVILCRGYSTKQLTRRPFISAMDSNSPVNMTSCEANLVLDHHRCYQ